jgi:hypothetical protein
MAELVSNALLMALNPSRSNRRLWGGGPGVTRRHHSAASPLRSPASPSAVIQMLIPSCLIRMGAFGPPFLNHKRF